MDMATALAELGVTAATLDAEATERLDRDGYAALPDVLSGEQVEAVRARLAELLAAEGERAGLEVHREGGTDRLADLVNKGAVFEPCFTDSRVLACIAHYPDTAVMPICRRPLLVTGVTGLPVSA